MNIRRQSGTFQLEEDPFVKNAQSFGKIYHEVLFLMKCIQTKPQVRNINNNYHNLYYTVVKIRDDKEIVNDEYENEYITFNDFITPNNKPRETILK